MLNKSTVRAAQTVAASLSDMGITIMPNGDHELAVLNRASTGLADSTIHSPEELDSFIESLTKKSDNSEHHSTLINFADKIGKLASTHIAHDNSVVAPMVNEFAQGLAKFISSLEAKDPTTSFEVVMFKKPLLADNPAFVAELSQVSTGVKPKSYFDGLIKTEEQVLQYLDFPQADLNVDIAQWWLGTNGFAYRLYQNIFGGGTPAGTKPIHLDEIDALPIHERMSAGILFILMGIKLSVEPPAEMKSMSLVEFNNSVQDYIDYGRSLFDLSARQYAQALAGSYRLILDTDIKPNNAGVKITVVGEAYDGWLAEGGKPEVLFGAVIAERGSVMHRAMIDDNSEKYLKEWNTFSSIEKARFNHGRLAAIVSYIEQQGLDAINYIRSNEEDGFYKTDTYVNTAKAKLAQCLSSLTEQYATKVYDVAIAVVAGCGYFNTNSQQTLRIIHDLGESNPGIDPKDAATIAALRYVTDFVSTLIGAKKI